MASRSQGIQTHAPFADRFLILSVEDIGELAEVFDGSIIADHFLSLRVYFDNWVKCSAFELAIGPFGIYTFANSWKRKKDEVVIHLKDGHWVDPNRFNQTIEAKRRRRELLRRFRQMKPIFDKDWAGQSVEAALAWLGRQAITRGEPQWRIVQCDIVTVDGTQVRHAFCSRQDTIMDLTRFPFWWGRNEYFQAFRPINLSAEYSYVDWIKSHDSSKTESQ